MNRVSADQPRNSRNAVENKMEEIFIDRRYLQEHPMEILVFGDNTIHRGFGGAAELRDEPNTYGFITKRYPSNHIESFYGPEEYAPIYLEEMVKLKKVISDNPERTYLISKLGAGLANKYHVFEKVIEPVIRQDLAGYKNVKFLW